MDVIFAIPVFGAAFQTLTALPTQYPTITTGMTLVYLGGLVCTNVIGAYTDTLAAVLAYRRSKHSMLFEPVAPSSEWDAARMGARANGWRRLMQSIVWPATIAMDIVPNVVLYIHSNEPAKKK